MLGIQVAVSNASKKIEYNIWKQECKHIQTTIQMDKKIKFLNKIVTCCSLEAEASNRIQRNSA